MFKRLPSKFISFYLLLFSACLLMSCEHQVQEGMIVITQVEKNQKNAEMISVGVPIMTTGSKLLKIDPEYPEHLPVVLTRDFYSAASPTISFDAQRMVFAGQKNQNDIWQIYEMDLSNMRYEAITSGLNNSLDPMYLPGNKILYTQLIHKENEKGGQILFVKSVENGQEEQITFTPGIYSETSVLHDGRIIALYRPLFSDDKDFQIRVMRPDGTKEMLFYETKDGSEIQTIGGESNNGKIYFLEKNRNGIEKLSGISYSNPEYSKNLISHKLKSHLLETSVMQNGQLLICYSSTEDDSSGVYGLDTSDAEKVKHIFNDNLYLTIDALAVERREVPKKIPSEVDKNEPTALLLCQDINFLGFQKDSLLTNSEKAVKIEILGQESSMGIVNVEKDGSVYLKIKADTPFKLQTLDQYGKIVQGPSSWLNLRPNERRACVGCHQGNEIVPRNSQPLAVLKEPVAIPVVSNLLAGK